MKITKQFSVLLILFILTPITLAATLPLQQLQLPPGFKISIYADHIPGARQMALGDQGTVFVGSRSEGKVYALLNPDHDYTKPITAITILQGLNSPNGVAFKNRNLYVAEINKITRFDQIEKSLPKMPSPTVINNHLPGETHHGWRYIKFGPDDWLYIGIGAPCNICLRQNPIFASLARMKSDGSDLQIYAHGVRNTVGFAWSPTHQLWFTENGRDWLGDDIPPDELNTAPQANLHFGFPYFYGKNIPDPEYGRNKSDKGFTPSTYDLPAHAAALGMIFYSGTMFPEQYRGNILIAEHGSWNRSRKVGYRISRVKIQDNKATNYQPFISGWLQNQAAWGRPVDLLQLPDGSVLISDDYNGVIYRVSYTGNK